MPSTIVLQSHRAPLPHTWLQDCLDSVYNWAQLKGFDYRYINDELFSCLPQDQVYRVPQQTVIASDLARLLQLRALLKQGYSTVIWCDADLLIFNPQRFDLIDENYALGREVWIQTDDSGKARAFRKVHNAFLMFRQGNSFLDFYIETALKLLRQAGDRIPPQFIGPKLLSALHNIAQCPVQETAAMFSPSVIRDINKGGGDALALLIEKSEQPCLAANLCISSVEGGALTSADMAHLIDRLQQDQRLRPPA